MKKGLSYGLLGVLAGLLSGVFGAGGGIILILGLERVFNLPPHKAHATTVAISLPITLVITTVYLYHHIDSINWIGVLAVSCGGVIGGYFGAKYLKKISGKWLHRIFGVFMILAALNMIRG